MKLNKKAVEQLLASNHLSKSQLAELCGVSKSFISAVTIRGTCQTKTAGRIAEALNIDVTEIMAEE